MEEYVCEKWITNGEYCAAWWCVERRGFGDRDGQSSKALVFMMVTLDGDES